MTELVKNFRSTPDVNGSGRMVVVDNALFFEARDDIGGFGLWKSDGTEEGTVLVKAFSQVSLGDTLGELTPFGNTLFFSFISNGENSGKLWKSDGTELGTVLVKNINPTAFGFGSSTGGGNTVYFHADNGTDGNELWKTDGTEAGTVMVLDIANGSDSSFPYLLGAIDNILYFEAANSVRGLWTSDGTETGTTLVRSLNIDHGKIVNRSIYLTAYTIDDSNNDYELWISDGTSAGTSLLKNKPGLKWLVNRAF